MNLPIVTFMDTETGGLRPEHPTIQIAAISVDSEWKELETFERKIVFDPLACDAEALEINHYDAKDWATEAKPLPMVLSEFAGLLNRHRCVDLVSKAGNPYRVVRLAGHNIVGFDLKRVSAAFKRLGIFFPIDFKSVLDTRQGAVWHFEKAGSPPADYKLTTLAKHFRIDTTGAHEALADVRMSIEIAKRLLA